MPAGAQEGHGAFAARSRRSPAAGVARSSSRGSTRRRVEDEAAERLAARRRRRGRPRRQGLHRPLQLFASGAGVLVVDKDLDRPLNRIDEAITIATLPAFKPVVEAGRDDGDRQDHPVRGRRAALMQAAPRRAAVAAGAVAPYTAAKGRRGRDAAAGVEAVGHGQDPAAARGAAGAGRRAIVAESACRTTAALGRALADAQAEAGNELMSCSARRPWPTAATSSRPRSRRWAARSSISACRSIRAI
jgi:hypothetical protein